MPNVRGPPAASALVAAAALLAVFTVAFRHASCLNPDGIALLTFKRKLKSDPLNALASWNASHDSPCSSWTGVTCENVADRLRVVSLTLPGLRLSGPISPAAIGSLDALRRLSLQNNNLSGAVPPQLLNSSSLTSVLLRHNRLSGALPLPSVDGGIRRCNVRILDLSENALSGSIPPAIAACSALQSLLLSENRLTGVIPAGLGSSFQSLEELDLSSNQLVGAIPDDLGRLSSLRGALNLSHNKLSGSIPASLGSFPYMVSLDLSYNNLRGQIPQNGSLAAQPAGAFFGNPQLCGPPLRESCPKTAKDRRIPNFPGNGSGVPPAPAPHRMHNTMMLGAGAIVGVVFGNVVAVSIAAVLLMYCCHKSRRRSSTWMVPPKPTRYSGNHNFPYASKLRVVPPKWSTSAASMAYSRSQHSSASSEGSGSPQGSGGGGTEKGELVVLDEGFGADMEELLRSSAYMLGRSEQGIVYKVVLGSGKAVAVRRLDGGGGRAAAEMAEWRKAAESLGRLRHSNIVRLLAYYYHHSSSAHEKLLIHDFIPHGTLASALFFGGGDGRKLQWTERLTVIERTASALAYIHDHRTAHGDVKSSNILLGGEDRVTPYLADLGLRKLRSFSCCTDAANHEPAPAPAFESSLPESRESDQLFSSIYHYHLPPEAAERADAAPTEEWDVYGFGVVMMEVVTGRSAAEMRARAKKHETLMCSAAANDVEDDNVDLVSWVQSCLVVRRCSVRHVLDPKLIFAETRMNSNRCPPHKTGELESEPSHSAAGADGGLEKKLVEPPIAAAAGSVLDLAMACTSFLPVHRPRMTFVAHALHHLLST